MGGKQKSKNVSHSLNKFMHPRNPYNKFPSFKELAIAYPQFRAHCTYDFRGKIVFDFKNPEALRALAICLMDKDFNLKIKIPGNRLVPTIPLRLNYLLWIEDLLSLIYPKGNESKKPIIGLDIGTGAACVYPLLGVTKFGWNFIATETDDLSFESAKENVEKNNLQEHIYLHKSSEFLDVLREEDVKMFVIKHVHGEIATKEFSPSSMEDSDRKMDEGSDHRFLIDFTMCNPPFFSSEEEMNPKVNNKKESRSQPNSISTGTTHEKVTEGGEINFIGKMIEKSLRYKDSVKIFSTLIGKKNDVKAIINLIKEKAKDSFVRISDTEFCQGRTMRWGVAWTFHPGIPLEKILSKKKKLSMKPLVLPFPRSRMTSYNVLSIWPIVASWLKDIKIKPNILKKNKYHIVAMIRAYKPTWLHQRQKRRLQNVQSSKSLSTMEIKEVPFIETMEVQEGNSLLKRRNEEEEEEVSSPKKPKLTSNESKNMSYLSISNRQSESSNNCEVDDEINSEDISLTETQSEVNEVSLEDKNTEGNTLANSSPDKKAKGGLECLLKCTLCMKQVDNLVSLEMNYVSGIGKRDSMYQLLQYMTNRLNKGEWVVTYKE